MNAQTIPWYRQTWPWLLISGPAIVVVASFVTLALAISSNDGLVVDDYYTEGLAINRSLERDAQARALGLAATMSVTQEGGADRVRVDMDGSGPQTRTVLHLLLAHPTRSGQDREINLLPTASGSWAGTMPPMPAGHWRVLLEAPAAGWRLVGEWNSAQTSLELRPVPGESVQ